MNRQNADMVLVCGDVTIPVHSFILCPRSKFFDAAINGPFKVREGMAFTICIEADTVTGGLK
jgi:hypothetical protein